MTQRSSGSAPPAASSPAPRLDRRELMTLAAAALGATTAGCATGGVPSSVNPRFAEPTTAAEYMSTMKLGTQAGDYLEMPYVPAGLPNETRAADFDVMRNEGRFDHVRIPAACHLNADVDGRIEEDFLRKVDAQVAMALERFERVVVDPLHHYAQWKGEHGINKFQRDAERVGPLTADQHAVRATAMWTQLATRYKDVSLRLSFDLFNEPGQAKKDEGPPGLTAGQLNAWHAAVLPAIRATGGRNARRMVWLEGWNNRIDLLTIPPNAGVIGVSPHYYSPFNFTHQGGSLTAGGMASYVEDIKYAKRWGEINRVPVWIGEAGVSRRIDGKRPRPPAERAEYTAHLRNTALALDVPVCYWGYNSNFAQYDQPTRQWLPGMRQAVSGLPTPLPVRAVPSFIQLKGGRIARLVDPNAWWSGFSYDPQTGILNAQANTTGSDRSLVLVFPEVPVQSDEVWISRATEFTGSWGIGTCPFYLDDSRSDRKGTRGIDVRAKDLLGRDQYPNWRPAAPGGHPNAYGKLASGNTYFAIDLIFQAGSPAGNIRFACIQAT